MANISSYPNKAPKPGDRVIFSETYDQESTTPTVGNPTKSATLTAVGAAISPSIAEGTTNNVAMFSTENKVVNASPVPIIQGGGVSDILTIGQSGLQTVIFNANVEFQEGVKDSTGSFGTADQVLTTDGSATFWQDATTGTVTGGGTLGTLAIWSTGTELEDSPITVTADGSSWDYEFEATNEFIINSNGVNNAFLRVNEAGSNALVFSYDSEVQLGSFYNYENGGFNFSNPGQELLSIGTYINSDTVVVHTDLEVRGATTELEGLLLNAELEDGSGSTGTSGQLLSSTGTATQWVDASSSPYTSMFVRITQSGNNQASYSVLSNTTEASITSISSGNGKYTLFLASGTFPDDSDVMVITGGYRSARSSESQMSGYYTSQQIIITTGWWDYDGGTQASFVKEDLGFGGTESLIFEFRVFS